MTRLGAMNKETRAFLVFPKAFNYLDYEQDEGETGGSDWVLALRLCISHGVMLR